VTGASLAGPLGRALCDKPETCYEWGVHKIQARAVLPRLLQDPATVVALAEALCQAQEAGRPLGGVAETTARHWRGVAARALPFLLGAGSAAEGAEK
jgi:hypothetical protein